MLRLNDAHLFSRFSLLETGASDVRSPGPGVAIPQSRKQRELRLLGAMIDDLDTDTQIFRRRLGILHKHIKVPVLVEDAGVEQFKLRIVAPSMPILLDQLSIGEGRLRVLVEILHVGMCRQMLCNLPTGRHFV